MLTSFASVALLVAFTIAAPLPAGRSLNSLSALVPVGSPLSDAVTAAIAPIDSTVSSINGALPIKRSLSNDLTFTKRSPLFSALIPAGSRVYGKVFDSVIGVEEQVAAVESKLAPVEDTLAPVTKELAPIEKEAAPIVAEVVSAASSIKAKVVATGEALVSTVDSVTAPL